MSTKKTILISVVTAVVTIGLFKLFEKDRKFVTITENPVARYANFSINPDYLGQVDFTYAAEITTPAVVHVKTIYMPKTTPNLRNNRHPFYDFFDQWGDESLNYNYPQNTQPRIQAGSGVIISSDGLIVTNNHVIKNGDKIEVVLADKQSYTAELVGTDPSTDLALLKIDAKNLPFIVFGNSDLVKIGEWVLAVGNPFNLTSTVTAGIVSAKGRNINILRDRAPIESFIQTDAAVNPGNSGGALVNTHGKLIGINTAIATPTGTYTGYSFAVPVNLVRKVVDDLIEYGAVQRGFIGVNIRNIDALLAEEMDLNQLDGVYVENIVAGSGAEEAGLKHGDVIIKINKISVNSIPELQEQVAKYRPGDKIDVSLLRKGKKKTIQLTLKNREGTTDIVKPPLEY